METLSLAELTGLAALFVAIIAAYSTILSTSNQRKRTLLILALASTTVLFVGLLLQKAKRDNGYSHSKQKVNDADRKKLEGAAEEAKRRAREEEALRMVAENKLRDLKSRAENDRPIQEPQTIEREDSIVGSWQSEDLFAREATFFPNGNLEIINKNPDIMYSQNPLINLVERSLDKASATNVTYRVTGKNLILLENDNNSATKIFDIRESDLLFISDGPGDSQWFGKALNSEGETAVFHRVRH